MTGLNDYDTSSSWERDFFKEVQTIAREVRAAEERRREEEYWRAEEDEYYRQMEAEYYRGLLDDEWARTAPEHVYPETGFDERDSDF